MDKSTSFQEGSARRASPILSQMSRSWRPLRRDRKVTSKASQRSPPRPAGTPLPQHHPLSAEIHFQAVGKRRWPSAARLTPRPIPFGPESSDLKRDRQGTLRSMAWTISRSNKSAPIGNQPQCEISLTTSTFFARDRWAGQGAVYLPGTAIKHPNEGPLVKGERSELAEPLIQGVRV